jgi:[ribosomal protein S18]-alanine N-acetyltransferase
MRAYPTAKSRGAAVARAPCYRRAVRVRTLAEPDLEPCLDLFEAVAAEGRWLANEPPIDRHEVRARWIDLLATGEGTLLVAEDGPAPAGIAAMVGLFSPELGMLVREDRRRQGVGDALVRACVEWAVGRGAREVVLHVFPHNAAAIALYRKHGFEERGIVKDAYPRRNGEKWDAIKMVKALAPAGRTGRGSAAGASGSSM